MASTRKSTNIKIINASVIGGSLAMAARSLDFLENLVIKPDFLLIEFPFINESRRMAGRYSEINDYFAFKVPPNYQSFF